MKRGNKKRITIQTKYGVHAIVLERDEKKGYIAIAPDLEGVITWGKNIAHVKAMAREAIELCIESLVMRRAPSIRKISHQKHITRGLISAGI